MDRYWHPGDGRMFWSGYEGAAREMRFDADAVKFGEMSRQEYGNKYGANYGSGIDGLVNGLLSVGVLLVSNELNSSKGGDSQFEQDDKDPEFYYDALDGLELNDGSKVTRDQLNLTFDKSAVGNATYRGFKNGKHHINFNIESYEVTRGNIRALGIHEIWGHGVKKYKHFGDHHKAYFDTIDSKYWEGTTEAFKKHETDWMYRFFYKEKPYERMPARFEKEYFKYQRN